MTEESLLKLYDHTLEVRLWNSKEKLAPRARFDRPKAFRLPVPPARDTDEQPERRPDKFPLVKQQMEPAESEGKRRRNRVKKKELNASLVSEDEIDPDLSSSISEFCRVELCTANTII